jgi:hypothetical protein
MNRRFPGFIFFVLAFLLNPSSKAEETGKGFCGSMPVGYHEFGLFGKEAFYLSHFPEFSSIHAYQVIVEVRLRATDHDPEKILLEHKAQHPLAKYTVSPYRRVRPTKERVKDQEDWVLPEKMAAGKTFNADIQFTENKITAKEDYNVTVEVKRVIHLRLLDPSQPRPGSLSYLLFGNGKENFLGHYVTAPPNPGEQVRDFDQILSTASGDTDALPEGLYSVPSRKNTKAERLRNSEVATLTGSLGVGKIKITGEILDNNIGTQR